MSLFLIFSYAFFSVSIIFNDYAAENKSNMHKQFFYFYNFVNQTQDNIALLLRNFMGLPSFVTSIASI
jgi:hypothetical protein